MIAERLNSIRVRIVTSKAEGQGGPQALSAQAAKVEPERSKAHLSVYGVVQCRMQRGLIHGVHDTSILVPHTAPRLVKTASV